MRFKRLPRLFYIQPTLKVTKELLGKYMVSPIRKSLISNEVKKLLRKKLIGKIVETEAYIGPKDRASHAYGHHPSFHPPAFGGPLGKITKKILGQILRR